MDDFLGKPFTPSQLLRVIDRALSGTLRPAGDDGAPNAEMDRAAYQRLAGELGVEDAAELLHAFADDARERLRHMRLLALGKETALLAGEAQAIHDAAGSLGFLSIAASANRILRDPSADNVFDEVTALAKQLEDTISALQPTS
jgi:HPt (histidine-containing phosphotransfer) domain-containing protein